MCRTEIRIESGARMALLVLVLYLSSTSSVKCTNYGSNTTPSREAFAFAYNGASSILRFAGMYNGFMLNTYRNPVSATFDSCFPIGATLALGGSNNTLVLTQDLFLASDLILASFGNIIGNGHCVEFAPHDQTILLPYLGTVTALGSQTTGFAVYTVGWSFDGKYIAFGTASQSGTGPELVICTFDGHNVTPAATFTFGLDVNNLAWQPVTEPPYYLVAGTSGGLYAFQFIPQATLNQTSSIATGTNVTAVAWHPSGKWLAAGKNLATEEIAIYNFNAGLLTANTGYAFANTQSVSRGALDFDYTGSHLAVGVNNTNQLQVLSWNGVSLLTTTSANAGTIVNAVSWSPDGSLIAVGLNSGTYPVQVYSFNRTINSLSLVPSYASPCLSPIYSLEWLPNSRLIAAGGYDRILVLTQDPTTQRFLFAVQVENSSNVYSAKWSPNGTYLACGFYPSPQCIVYTFIPDTLTLQNTNLVFNSPTQLRGSLVFNGPCVIDCNGFTFDANSQVITVTSGSSLLIRNAVLEGITGTNMQCIDYTGSVSLQHVTFIVNNTMQWGQGQLTIMNDCSMSGTGKFIYSSNQPVTISHASQWCFDRGMTFSYYPQSGTNNLINFADSTGQLYLYETALHAQSSGLQFIKGIVAIDGKCPFYSDAVVSSNGILFGDNSFVANNVNLMILPESGIDCRSGYVVDQNIGG